MSRTRAQQSSWISILLFSLVFQALLPSGFMFGGSQGQWITLCTSNGVSAQLVEALGDDPSNQGASHSDEGCPQSLLGEEGIIAQGHNLPGQLTESSPRLAHTSPLSLAPYARYLSRAPPRLV